MDRARAVIDDLLLETGQVCPPVQASRLAAACGVRILFSGPCYEPPPNDPRGQMLAAALSPFEPASDAPVQFNQMRAPLTWLLGAIDHDASLVVVDGARYIHVLTHHMKRLPTGGITWGKPKPSTRLTFSVAHELGHLIKHHWRGVRCPTLEEEEWEANDLAGYMLAPDAWVREMYAILEGDVDALARRFWLSRQCIRHRLAALDLPLEIKAA